MTNEQLGRANTLIGEIANLRVQIRREPVWLDPAVANYLRPFMREKIREVIKLFLEQALAAKIAEFDGL